MLKPFAGIYEGIITIEVASALVMEDIYDFSSACDPKTPMYTYFKC